MSEFTREQHVNALKRAVDAGDIESANEIAAFLDTNYPPPPSPAPVPMEPEPSVTDLLDTTKELPANILASLDEGGARIAEGLQDPMATPISTAADIVRPALDVMGDISEVGMEAWKQTWGRHPLFDNPVVRSGVESLGNSKAAHKAMDALSKGYDWWVDFKETHPTEASMLEDIGVLAEVFPSKLPTKQAGVKLTSKGTAQAIEQRRKGLTRLIRPDDFEGEGEVIETSTLTGRRKVYVPGDREDTIIKTLELVDDVDPDRSYTFNHNVVDKEARKLRARLEKTIKSRGNPRFDKDDVLEELALVVEEMPSLPGYHALSGDAQTKARELMQEMIRIINEKGNKSMDLLKARREFDKHITLSGGKYNADVENAKIFAARELRNVLNDTLKKTVKDDNVHDLLTRQHNLLSGRDIIRAKRAKEASSAFSRVFHKLREYGHLPSTPLALYATAGAAAPFLGPGAAAGGAAGITAWQTYKTLSSGERKREIGRLLKALGNLPAEEVAADKALLIELLKTPMPEQEDNGGN